MLPPRAQRAFFFLPPSSKTLDTPSAKTLLRRNRPRHVTPAAANPQSQTILVSRSCPDFKDLQAGAGWRAQGWGGSRRLGQ